jgi:excisionase family DNA binding protein
MVDARLTLTVPQFATEVGIGLTSAWKLVRVGTLPVIRVGKRVLISRATLDRFLAGEIAA